MSPAVILALIGNLIPLAGLHYWGWDPFQLLMLYWMETVIVAGWALARIATLPDNLLGRMTVNGREQPATHGALLGMFGGMAVAFCLAHFFFLWMIFQDGWRGRVDGPTSFVRVFVIESGAWAVLLFAFLAGAIAFLTSPTRPHIARLVEARILRKGIVEKQPQLDEATHGVGAAVGGLLGRIVIMQAAVIFGGDDGALLRIERADVYRDRVEASVRSREETAKRRERHRGKHDRRRNDRPHRQTDGRETARDKRMPPFSRNSDNHPCRS